MKKILVLLGLFVLTTNFANANQNQNFDNRRPPMPPSAEQRAQREAAFDQRLGLTDEQKQQAKELRLRGHDELKPIMDKIKSRHQEADMVKKSKLSTKAQEEKLNSINSDIKDLHKQAHEIRKENMKEFENILTTEQKNTLKEMKKEGRENFYKQHPNARKRTMQYKN